MPRGKGVRRDETGIHLGEGAVPIVVIQIILETPRAVRHEQIEIAVLVLFVQCLVFGPLCLFAPQLALTKRMGLGEYGTLAQRYVREFDAKWVRGGAVTDEALVGSADIQSLADLGNSFEIVQTMRFAPVTRDAILRLAAATLLPLAPLLLTIMPLEALLGKLVGILF